ncbi:STAS domain-containing protein [Amycolatopsis sp. NPDC051371]|uniref:STAS domain-containing protein n=1 Tax=Amycolatopsis sp. NPDC051371 TaxID=3155800 RepID=UPI00341702EC
MENPVPAEGEDAVISRRRTRGSVVITVAGEVDTLDADGLVECVRESATTSAFSDDLVLDFRDVSFVSVSVLGRLVAVRDRLTAQGRTVRMCAPAGRAGRYFAMVGL